MQTDYQDLKFSLPNPTTQPTLITHHLQGYIQVLRLATIAYSKANVSPPNPPQSTTGDLQPRPPIHLSLLITCAVQVLIPERQDRNPEASWLHHQSP